jgi:hypothetical protein
MSNKFRNLSQGDHQRHVKNIFNAAFGNDKNFLVSVFLGSSFGLDQYKRLCDKSARVYKSGAGPREGGVGTVCELKSGIGVGGVVVGFFFGLKFGSLGYKNLTDF